MLALVMSGGANFGAMQVGALEVLLELGIHPKMAVGTSAGAINALHFASDPTPDGARRLADLWQSMEADDIGRLNVLTGLQRLVTRKNSLFSSAPLVQYLQRNLPGVETFGQLAKMKGIRVYTTAVCMETAELIVFGDRDEDSLIDGAMASSAMLPFLPPWPMGKYRYLDGGYITKLPIRVAIERGATQIIALNAKSNLEATSKKARGILAVTDYALSITMERQVDTEISWAKRTGVPLRVIHLLKPSDTGIWNFSQAKHLIRQGREIAQRELEREPLKIYPSWQLWFNQIKTKILRRD